MEELYKRGFTAENMPEDDEEEAIGFSIGMPIAELSDKPCDEKIIENLNAIIASKKALFQKALDRKKNCRLNGNKIYCGLTGSTIELISMTSKFILRL